MKYRVEHKEKAVVGTRITEYPSIEAVLKEYPMGEHTYCAAREIPLESGDSANLVYDHYITLGITAL